MLAWQRGTPLLVTILVSTTVFVFGNRAAVAAWSPANCEFQQKHCYALTEWKTTRRERILNAGSYIETTQMYVPIPKEAFVDNEQWTGWRNTWWIEAGQAAGYPRTSQTKIYPFYAFNLKPNRERQEYEEFTSLNEVQTNTRNLYQFTGNGGLKPGREWCITEPWSSSGETKTSCFKKVYGPPTELETGVEAASDVEPTNRGFAEGFATGGRNGLWQSSGNPERHATLYTTPAATVCASEHWPGYGSLNFGAGRGCPLAAAAGPFSSPEPAGTATTGNAASGAAQPPSVAAIEGLARSEAALDQGEHPSSLTVWEGSLGRTMELMRPGSARASSSASPGNYFVKPVYLVELRGVFTLHAAKHPPGEPEPSGTVLRLVFDAQTGALEGRYVGDTPLARTHGLRAAR